MEVTILLDHDLAGFASYFATGLQEIGWDQTLTCRFKRLGDYELPDNYPDQAIWRFAQRHRLWLVTNNRNGEDETSLQVTIEHENTPDALPVITISNKEKLRQTVYRQRVLSGLVEVVISPEQYCGTGRVFLPL